mmetsp:Transcript_15734/g.42256  ORF Transcript_15734/g.42256 Transcript_15734/m.42256 type:complete len:280 (-) Transcript_15734:718-1557(-)
MARMTQLSQNANLGGAAAAAAAVARSGPTASPISPSGTGTSAEDLERERAAMLKSWSDAQLSLRWQELQQAHQLSQYQQLQAHLLQQQQQQQTATQTPQQHQLMQLQFQTQLRQMRLTQMAQQQQLQMRQQLQQEQQEQQQEQQSQSLEQHWHSHLQHLQRQQQLSAAATAPSVTTAAHPVDAGVPEDPPPAYSDEDIRAMNIDRTPDTLQAAAQPPQKGREGANTLPDLDDASVWSWLNPNDDLSIHVELRDLRRDSSSPGQGGGATRDTPRSSTPTF